MIRRLLTGKRSVIPYWLLGGSKQPMEVAVLPEDVNLVLY